MEESFEQIAKIIAEHGGRMYLVGGAVRDMALKKVPHDKDFCVTGLSIEEFKELFPKAPIQGKDFPVFIINGCEFALARKERKIGEKHTDFEIIADKAITIEEDLSRRDLTINAMAMDFLTKELIDPFHGIEDLKNKTLRMTTEAFCEDPLRVYRVARFAARFGFDIDAHTLEVMHSMKDSLASLSAERVCAEFRRALLEDRPAYFFNTLKNAGVLEVHFKELADLIGVEQPIQYHPEGDAYTHSMEVLERAVRFTPNFSKQQAQMLDKKGIKITKPNRNSKTYRLKRDDLGILSRRKVLEQRELIRFCALVHDFGKASTPRDKWPHHYGHEEAGIPLVTAFCHRIKLPNAFEKAGKITCEYHMKAGRYHTLKASTKVKLFDAIYKSRSISYEGMEIIAKCDSKNNKIRFANVARQVMQIGATPEMKEKCGNDYNKLKLLIHERRTSTLKTIEASIER